MEPSQSLWGDGRKWKHTSLVHNTQYTVREKVWEKDAEQMYSLFFCENKTKQKKQEYIHLYPCIYKNKQWKEKKPKINKNDCVYEERSWKLAEGTDFKCNFSEYTLYIFYIALNTYVSYIFQKLNIKEYARPIWKQTETNNLQIYQTGNITKQRK